MLVHVPAALLHDRQATVQASTQHAPSMQLPVTHAVPAVHAVGAVCLSLHAPVASQVLLPLQLSSSALSTLVVHVPAVFAHDRHAPEHASAQQTPSTQRPLA